MPDTPTPTERPTHDADGNEIIYLVKPIKVVLKRAGQDAREETFTELTFHEFSGKDMRAIDGLGENAGSILLAMMARMVRQPVQVIEGMKHPDFGTLATKVQAFLPGGQLTGATG